MESSSDLSSIVSRHEQNEVPSIHIQQFVLDQHARNLSSIHSSRDTLRANKNFPRIFTVAQTLKDPLILNHIKPDYGSLGDFIGDLNIGRDLLNSQKKKKNDAGEQQIQEKKVKAALKDKTHEQLNNVFIDKSSSTLHKKVAGKLLVENLFKDSFGMTLNSFENQNVKVETVKNYKINLGNIDEIFSGKNNNVNKNQQKTDKKTTRVGENSKSEIEAIQNKSKEIRSWTYNQRVQLLEQIKFKYPSLRRLEIKKQCRQYDKLFPKVEDEDDIHQSRRSSKSNQVEKPSHVVQISETSLRVEKLSLKPEVILYILSQNPIQKLQSISLAQIRVAEELMCFILEVIKNICQGLSKLSLRCLSMQKNENVAAKIKEILENLPLRQLILEYIDFETKEFCVICLGVGSNTTLESLNFDNNGVDERSCKSLELIAKHCARLKKISLKKNYLQPHHFSYFNAESKAKIEI